MTGKRYKSVGANLECPNGMEYMLVKRDDGFNVCQVCSKYTAKEIVDELNNLADENEQLKQFKDRVFNLFAKEIKEENELLDYYIKEKAPYTDRQQIIIGVLKRLQKELEE